MFISEEEAARRIGMSSPTVRSRVEIHNFRGRKVGDKALPEIMKPIIGASDRLSGPAKTAKEFGVSLHASNYLGDGKTRYSAATKSPELESKISKIVGEAQEKAAERLLASLGLLTEDKLENAKAKDLAVIASNMSKIIENTKPAESTNNMILIYAPRQRDEDRFDVIEV